MFFSYAASISDRPAIALPYVFQGLLQAKRESNKKQVGEGREILKLRYPHLSQIYQIRLFVFSCPKYKHFQILRHPVSFFLMRNIKYRYSAGRLDETGRLSRYALDQKNFSGSGVREELEKYETLEELSDALLSIINRDRPEKDAQEGRELDVDENNESIVVYQFEGHHFHPSHLVFVHDVPLNGSARMMALSLLIRSMSQCSGFSNFVSLLQLFDFLIADNPLSDLIELTQILTELIEVTKFSNP